MNLKKSNKSHRIYQIDLLRFLAALAVVFYHYTFRGNSADFMSSLNFDEINDIFKYGYLGVNIFFIISGFVIILSIRKRSLRDFWNSRISRLYPSYWLSVVLTFTIIWFYGFPRYSANFYQLFTNLSMFQNYLGVPSIDGVYWSLFVEMKFYIFVISSYLIINKIKEIKLDYLICCWLALSLTYVLFTDAILLRFINYFFILNWSSYFISGIIFYQIYSIGINFKYLILLTLSLGMSLYQAISDITLLEAHYNADFSPVIISTIIVLFYIIMMLISLGKFNSINSPKLVQLGILTYPLYLIHQNIGYIIFNHFDGLFNKYAIFIVTMIFMVALSYVISKYYEPLVSKFLKISIKKLAYKINIEKLARTKA